MWMNKFKTSAYLRWNDLPGVCRVINFYALRCFWRFRMMPIAFRVKALSVKFVLFFWYVDFSNSMLFAGACLCGHQCFTFKWALEPNQLFTTPITIYFHTWILVDKGFPEGDPCFEYVLNMLATFFNNQNQEVVIGTFLFTIILSDIRRFCFGWLQSCALLVYKFGLRSGILIPKDTTNLLNWNLSRNSDALKWIDLESTGNAKRGDW